MLPKNAVPGGKRKKRRRKSTGLDLVLEVVGTDLDQEAERGGDLEVDQPIENPKNLAERSPHNFGMCHHLVLSI